MRLCVCVCKGHTAIVSLALAKEAVCDITNKGVGECTNVRTQVHWLGLSSKALSVSWAQSYARLSTGLQLNNSSVCVSLCICMYTLHCFITMCVYSQFWRPTETEPFTPIDFAARSVGFQFIQRKNMAQKETSSLSLNPQG